MKNEHQGKKQSQQAIIHLIKVQEQVVKIWGSVEIRSQEQALEIEFHVRECQVFPCKNDGIVSSSGSNNSNTVKQLFTCEIPLSTVSEDYEELTLFLMCCGKLCRVESMSYGKYCATGPELGIYSLISKNLMIMGQPDRICFQSATWARIIINRLHYFRTMLFGHLKGSKKALLARLAIHFIRARYHCRPLWMMNDRIDQAGDNGEAFFQWVCENRNKIVTPAFVIHSKTQDYCRLSLHNKGKIIPYGSWTHKLLYLSCEAVFSSAGEHNFLMPLGKTYIFFRDIVSQKKLIYLQHGVTKSDLSAWLGIREKNLSGFITSSKKERDFILSRYGYTAGNLWLTGMARFDLMGKKTADYPVPRQITIMPTWRKYLMSELNSKDGSRQVLENFEESIYVKAFRALTEDPRLKAEAKKNGYTIAFRPHPNVMAHIDKFHFGEDIVIDNRPVAEVFASTALLINDYSSGSMDFSYLYRPVIFYQFDREEFFSGAHTFTEENIDYKEGAFGELVFEHEELIALILDYIKNYCAIKEQYRNRIDDFFCYHDFNNCQRIFEKAQHMLSVDVVEREKI